VSARRRRAAGLVCAAGATAFWLGFLWANGPAVGNDTEGYLRLARALAQGQVITSFRTPGYPLVLAGLMQVASAARVDFATLVAAVQTLLLAGAGSWFVFDLGVRLTGRVAAGVLAAALFAGDADLQQFGAAQLTEALAVFLAVWALHSRIRDGGWRRAAWILAALALVRPNFAVFPVVFALLDAVRLRRPSVAVELLGPAAILIPLWWIVSLGSGANPWRPYQWFVPVHTFGTVYEADLWRRLPDGPDRALVARLRGRGVDPYRAVEVIERERGPGSAGRIARAAVAAAPLGYAAARARLLRHVFRQGSFLRPELIRLRHPDARWIAAIRAWRDAYRDLLYASFPLFLVLLGLAWWNGLGWPAAVGPFRHLLGPFVVVLFVSTAMSSLSSYDVGRLGLAFRPVNGLLWAMAVVGVAVRAGRWRRGRVAATASDEVP
jgi:hypothetical protein